VWETLSPAATLFCYLLFTSPTPHEMFGQSESVGTDA